MAFLPKKSYRFLDSSNSSSVAPEPLFEFDESDLWTTNRHSATPPSQEVKSSIPTFRFSKKPSAKKIEGGGGVAKSMPVSIPDWSKLRYNTANKNAFQEDDNDEEDEKVPPHEYLLARQMRNCEMVSFSVHEGRGRTLKGRDLSRVRNAIFEKTGFED